MINLSIKYYATEEYVNDALANNAAKDAILYTEQELTSEQRAQARANISQHGEIWHTIESPNMEIADYGVLKYGNAPSFDMDAALNMQSVSTSSYNILGSMIQSASMIGGVTQESLITYLASNIVADFDALYNAGLLTSDHCWLAQRNKDVFPSEVGLTLQIYRESALLNGTFPVTHVIGIGGGERTGTIHYNSTTNECVTGLTLFKHTNKTLTEAGYAADAKAVGDALANHTHDDKYYTEAEVDALIASVANNEVFVITVTKGDDGTYSADKTYDEVYDAYINKKELSVRYNGEGYDGIYPLSFYDGDSPIPGFSFDFYSFNNKRAQRQMIMMSANGISLNVAEFSQDRIATVNTNSTLTTTDKTLVGAINEINEKVGNTVESDGVIITSPNGTKYRITVSDDGTLSAILDGIAQERLEGDGQEFYTTAPSTLSFRSTAPLNELQEIQINGMTVDSANYTLEEGSTIVKLKHDYLSTLDVGSYEIAVVSDSKTVKGEFTVAALELNEHGFYYGIPYSYCAEFDSMSFPGIEGAVVFLDDDTIINMPLNEEITYSQLLKNETDYSFSMSFPDGDVTVTGNFATDGKAFVVANAYVDPSDELGLGQPSFNVPGFDCVFDPECAAADADYFYVVDFERSKYLISPKGQKDSYKVSQTNINGKPVSAITYAAFYNRADLKSIEISSSITYLGFNTFVGCTGLDTIIFSGTVSQWNAVDKGGCGEGEPWNRDIPATYVQCSDGQVAL